LRSSVESLRSRMGRVLKESGVRGFPIRMAARSLIFGAQSMANAADWILTRAGADWYTSKAYRTLLSPNKSYKNIHAGERCVIVGTGPSLLQQDISLLDGQNIFTVNQADRISSNVISQSRYHVIVDEDFMAPRYALELTRILKFLKTNDTQLITSIEMRDHLDRDYADHGLDGRLIPIKQMMLSCYWDRSAGPISIDLARVLPGFTSVVHLAISSALYMGFKEIVLVGVDLDYFMKPNKTFERSYDADDQGEVEKAGSTTSELFHMDQVELTDWVAKEFRAYAKLNQTAQANGAKIINASAGGVLEIFPRMPLKDALVPT